MPQPFSLFIESKCSIVMESRQGRGEDPWR